MSKSPLELDFFRMEKESVAATPPAKNAVDRRRSFRDIQGVISKLNPELLKAVIASAAVDRDSGVAKSPKNILDFGNKTSSGYEITPQTAPMTIFYNGSVVVYDVPQHRAENILELCQQEFSRSIESDYKIATSSSEQIELLDVFNEGLPITRRKSLQRFLSKRKERLTLSSPYGGGCPLPTD